MIVKGTKQLGSFKRGVNIYVPKKKVIVPAAPSGIPVSTTNITLTGFNETNVGVDLTNTVLTLSRTNNGPNRWSWEFQDGNGTYFLVEHYNNQSPPFNTWYVNLISFEGDGFNLFAAFNPSTSDTTIPTTGWVLEPNVTGAITITAA